MIRLTIRQLEYFDALVQTRHFGRAAGLVGVTQPALSAQIGEMEQRLDTRLFTRGGKAVDLTEEGRALQARVEAILADLRELENAARRGRLAMTGRLRLGIIPTVAPYALPGILPELRRLFPGLALELREAVTQVLVDETLAGRIDAAIVALPLHRPGLAAEPIARDPFLLAIPASEPGFVKPPVPPESPMLERLMLLEEGHCMRDQALALCGEMRPAAMANYGATSLTTLLQMVAHGFGVTLIPSIALRSAQDLRDIRIVPFAEPAPARTLGLVWRRAGARAGQCAALAPTLRRILASGEAGNVDGEQQPQHQQRQEPEGEGGLAVAQAV
jgi:LysR family hydrogen peroxide-inducible transcriptional activator